MNRIVFLLSLLITIIGGISLLFIIKQSGWLLSWILGVCLGFYPFLFFRIAGNLFYRKTGKLNSYLIWVILIVKLIITMLVILLIGSSGFIVHFPFMVGFIIVAPVVITIILIDSVRNKKSLMPYGK